MNSRQLDRTSALILLAVFGYTIGVHVFAAIGLWAILGAR